VQAFDNVHTFLEVGCGIGAKMVMVEKVFNLQVTGFDRVTRYVRDAADLLHKYQCSANVYTQDALTFEAYGAFDIVWYNRVLVMSEEETELEKDIMRQMRPGAFLILGNASIIPSWPIVAQATAATVYHKPPAAHASTYRKG
jgi:trans-aconitate methyltransferase